MISSFCWKLGRTTSTDSHHFQLLLETDFVSCEAGLWPSFILRGRLERLVLVAVVDRVCGGGRRTVRSTFEDVEKRLGAHGLRVLRPVSVEIAAMPIMGATTSKADGHTLFVSSKAVDSGMLDGLIAHEMGHMLLTESGHPSHDPIVLGLVMKEVDIPREGRGVFGQAYNHVQDIYADDLAFLAGLEDRAYGFFSIWVRGNVSMRSKERWSNLGLCVSNGFALGNLARRDLLSPQDKLWDIAKSFDRDAGFQAVESFATLYESLPRDPSADAFRGQVRALAVLTTRVGNGSREYRTF